MGKRLLWLSICIGAGWLIGFAGSALSGSDRWYLAIPGAIALGWLFLADPSKCDPTGGQCRDAAPKPRRRP